MKKGLDSQEIAPPREYITISFRHHSSDGMKMFCDSSLLPWYHKWHIKFRLWIAKKLVKSCAAFAKPLYFETFTGTVLYQETFHYAPDEVGPICSKYQECPCAFDCGGRETKVECYEPPHG